MQRLSSAGTWARAGGSKTDRTTARGLHAGEGASHAPAGRYCLDPSASCTTAPLVRMATSLLPLPCCYSIRTRRERANCDLAQGICHCHAYLARLGLPPPSSWRTMECQGYGKLPHPLICRPTGWTTTLEDSAPWTRFDEEARLRLYERQYDIDHCAPSRK
jgi:hypothetical protein